MSKSIVIACVISFLIIGTTLVITRNLKNTNTLTTDSELEGTYTTNAVTEEDGTQVIQITAKGGYYPPFIEAKADKNTIIRMKTVNTFDCSSALIIPKLGIRQMLPQNGKTDINIGSQAAGARIDGTCSMGMYRFSIKFI